MKTQRKAMLIDITRCIGCQSCAAACKEARGFPAEPETKLSPTAFTVVEARGDKFVRRMCMHCEYPTCESVCPVHAIRKLDAGPVVYDAKLCMGCRYCLQACPFQVPVYEWDRLAPYVKKCDLCAARVEKGEIPVCVAACPAGAVVFGNRDTLLAEATRRISENASYVPHIYGAEEAGGTDVLFLSDVPFEKLGFVTSVGTEPLPPLAVTALNEVPLVATVGSSLLAALYWITQRRREVLQAEASEAGHRAASAAD